MSWRLFLTDEPRSRWREILLGALAAVALLVPMLFIANAVLDEYRRRLIKSFVTEADRATMGIASRLSDAQHRLEAITSGIAKQETPDAAELVTRPDRSVVASGIIEIERRGEDYRITNSVPADLGSRVDQAAQREAASAAIDTGEMRMSGKVGAFVAIFAPIYADESSVRTVAERRNAIRGLAIVVLEPDAMLEAIGVSPQLDVELYDGRVASESVIADSQPRIRSGPEASGASLQYTKQLSAFGRMWFISASPPPRIWLARRGPEILLVVSGGLIVVLVWLLLSTRKRSIRLGTKMLESFADLIVLVDANGTIVYATPAAAANLERTPDALVGLSFSTLVHPDDRAALQETLQRAIASDAAEKFSGIRVSANDRMWHELDGSVQRIDSRDTNPHLAIIARDVTEIRALERQLERAARMETLGSVAAKVAHEFNNVLLGLGTQAEILKHKYPHESQIQSSCDTMQRSVARGARITSEVLRSSRPASVHEAPIDLQHWLRDLEHELRPLVPRDIDFAIEMPSESLLLCGDANQLSQVMVNLVLNARDAIHRGGRVSCAAEKSHGGRFSFGVVPAGEFAHLRVSDTGEGIPAELMGHIFEPLFTTKETGTGLGLAVSYQIIAAHRGLIFAESTVGRGTDFHLFLPAVSKPDECGSHAA